MAGQPPPPPPPPWQPLPPIITDTDCSIGLCSLYCPQWCYAPPNPLYRSSFDADDLDDLGPGLSPVVVVVIAFLAAALLLTSAYFILHRYRRHRNSSSSSNNNNNHPLNSAPDPGPAGGIDESLIHNITVCRYRRGEGLVGGTSCSVCLSDFREEERLRLLPNCSHAFHVACVDSWLKSHPNCPLCRAGIAWASPPAPPRAEVAVTVEGGSGTDNDNKDDAGKSINNSDWAELGNGGIRPVRRSPSTGDGSLTIGTSSAPMARSLSRGRSSFDRRREGGVQPVLGE